MNDDDLVKRLRELRSNQYADPNTAPEFVFLDPDMPPSEWERQYSMDVVYVRADRIEELEAENGILRTEKHADAEAVADLKAKLAKAVDMLDRLSFARTTLAELKGQADE